MSNQYLDEWTKKIKKHLVGRKIVDVEYMTSKEAEKSGWYSRPICLLLDNNHWVVPMADDEGNNGGALSTTFEKLGTIPVFGTATEPADLKLELLKKED